MRKVARAGLPAARRTSAGRSQAYEGSTVRGLRVATRPSKAPKRCSEVTLWSRSLWCAPACICTAVVGPNIPNSATELLGRPCSATCKGAVSGGLKLVARVTANEEAAKERSSKEGRL